MGANGKSYGVIVLDPPKLIPDRDEVAPGKRKYFDLNVLAMKLVEPGGILVTCSCSGLLPPTDFLGLLRAGGAEGGPPGPDPGLHRRRGRPPRRPRHARKRRTSRSPGSGWAMRPTVEPEKVSSRVTTERAPAMIHGPNIGHLDPGRHPGPFPYIRVAAMND